MSEKCPKCGSKTECMGGHSAHPLNWYCSDEINCGWTARAATQPEKKYLYPQSEIAERDATIVEMRKELDQAYGRMEAMNKHLNEESSYGGDFWPWFDSEGNAKRGGDES